MQREDHTHGSSPGANPEPRYEVGIVAIHRVNAALRVFDGPIEAKLAISTHINGLVAEYQIANWGKVSVIAAASVKDLPAAIQIVERVTSELLEHGFLEADSDWISERVLASERSVLCNIFERNSGTGSGRPRNKKCFLVPAFTCRTLCAETQRRLTEALKRSRAECDFWHLEWQPFLRLAEDYSHELSLVLLGHLFELFDQINGRAAAQGRAERVSDLAIVRHVRDIHVELMRVRTARQPKFLLLFGEVDYRGLALFAAKESKPREELDAFVDLLARAPRQEIAHLLIDNLSAYVRRQIEQKFAPSSIYDVTVSRLLEQCWHLRPRFAGRPSKAAEMVANIECVWRAFAGPTGNRITWDGAVRSGDCVELVRDIARIYSVDLPLSALHGRGRARRRRRDALSHD